MARAALTLARAGALLLLLAVAVSGAEADRSYKVVVHRGNPMMRITRQELSAIFLRRRAEWPDGVRALPVDQAETAPVREGFSREVHGRKTAAIRSHWLQIVFAGRGVPPVEKPGDSEVIAYVRTTPGSVGYVSAAAPIDEVKVLRIDP